MAPVGKTWTKQIGLEMLQLVHSDVLLHCLLDPVGLSLKLPSPAVASPFLLSEYCRQLLFSFLWTFELVLSCSSILDVKDLCPSCLYGGVRSQGLFDASCKALT